MTKIPDNGGMVIFSISFSHEVTFYCKNIHKDDKGL